MKIKTDQVRVLRVVEYVGDRTWVEQTVAQSIHGTKRIFGKGEIRAATIGAYPDILLEAEKIEDTPPEDEVVI